jgi:hypothetical protein
MVMVKEAMITIEVFAISENNLFKEKGEGKER